ncbi:MAG: oxaloacetate decarboxylase subunit alpha [Roseburia sp.]|nr:oxaloacetate decarboxylase subunit alpha [Roseburia sp.]
MSEVAKKPIKITETILRDAHQSLIATRMTTEQMLPIIDKMDKVGYNAVECWGGATFDASLRFLKEDPWERLRKLKEGFKNTKLQMLFRGQNILGYRPYADDVVEYFVQKSIANGIDIIRIFDCLNDIRNLQTAVTACNKEKGHAQVALSYTLGDAYTLDYWMDMAKRVEEMGANSLCIKDMAGLLTPYKAEELIKALKSSTNLPIELHTHYTSGVASMTYMKAVEAGVDIIDTAMSPFALGTSQPATEVMAEAFRGTEYDPNFDQMLLKEIADYFRPMREEALKSGLLNPKVLGVDIQTLLYQVPGGMLSNMVSQLKEQNAEDKYMDVLEEIPRVRKDLGEPPLVTPSSQIVGTQAVFNVLMGERYKVATKETKDVLLGKYGQTVKPFNPEIVDKVLGEEKKNAITCRYADLLEPELDKIEAEMKQWKQQDEDVLSYALFPQVATDFFKYREAQQKGVDASVADTKNGAYPV